MTQRNKSNSRPFGIPLDSIIAALPAAARATQDGDSIVVRHTSFATKLDVVQPPSGYKPKFGRIKAVLQIRSALPADFASTVFNKPDMTAALNSYATLAALSVEDGNAFIGSRVTVYEGEEEAWAIYFPVIVVDLIAGTTSLMGAMSRALSKNQDKGGKSLWTKADFELTGSKLSHLCVCTTSAEGLTAEFGLWERDVTAAKGDATALLQLKTNQPHPEMGEGLFCLLQMPHQLKDEESLDRILAQLNRIEMEPLELAPHFGAWCRGRAGYNPAYISFLPNSLHSSGIALNISLWAAARARWASEIFPSLGVPTGRSR